MTDLNESLIAEFRHETATTLRMLERVPADALDWRPHEKSRTLGEIHYISRTFPVSSSRRSIVTNLTAASI